MRRWSRCAVGMLCLLVFTSTLSHSTKPAAAQQGRVDKELVKKLNRPGDLTLRNTSLSDALLTVAETWKVNIVVGQGVDGDVTGAFSSTPLHEILDSILQPNGYSYHPVGKSLVISRSDDGKLHPMFQSATISLRAANPEEIIDGARLFSSSQGRIQSVPSAGALVVFDFPANVKQIREFVDHIDRAAVAASGGGNTAALLEVREFSPQYVPAGSLKPVVDSVISKDGRVGVMDKENRIVVVDHATSLELVAKTIEQLDLPRPQVRITAFIYDISIEDIERLGINWNSANKWRHDGNGDPRGLLSVDSLMLAPAAAGDPSSTFTLMNLSRNIDVTGVVDALNRLTNARLLADPSITVVDRESATIQIVTEIPFQQLTQTGEGGNIGTTAFREAGVTLAVSPRIAMDGTLELDVTPTFSRLAGFTEGGAAQPIIDKREANTTVRVADKQTLVIGGLRQRDDIRNRRGVPHLESHRLFGRLFKGREDSIRESELVVFITPEIIMPCPQAPPREWANLEHGEAVLERIPVAPVLEQPCCEEYIVYEPGFMPQVAPEIIEPEVNAEEVVPTPPTQDLPVPHSTRWRLPNAHAPSPTDQQSIVQPADTPAHLARRFRSSREPHRPDDHSAVRRLPPVMPEGDSSLRWADRRIERLPR